MALLVLALICFCMKDVTSQSAHTQCSYIEDNLFTCDYPAMTSSSDRPIAYSNFSPEPQRIDLKVYGIFPFTGDSQVFSSTFGNINTAAFDSNYPASMTLDCYGDGIMMYTGAFANMSHVQKFKMKNCLIYDLPSRAFADFENIDNFCIEGGTIVGTDVDAWLGLNIEKLTNDAHSVPRNFGSFEILYTKFSTTYFPSGLLYNMKNLTSATLRGVGLDTLSVDIFQFNSRLKYIDISDNEIISIPNGIFDNLNSLAEVRTEAIFWQCSCSNNWFVEFFEKNKITLFGENICSNINGYTVFKYYHENCVSANPCEGATGFVLGKKCVSPISVIIMIFAFTAAGLVIASLVIVVTASKQYKAKDKRRRQAVGRWNKVIESSITKLT